MRMQQRCHRAQGAPRRRRAAASSERSQLSREGKRTIARDRTTERRDNAGAKDDRTEGDDGNDLQPVSMRRTKRRGMQTTKMSTPIRCGRRPRGATRGMSPRARHAAVGPTAIPERTAKQSNVDGGDLVNKKDQQIFALGPLEISTSPGHHDRSTHRGVFFSRLSVPVRLPGGGERVTDCVHRAIHSL